jgi:hypothetical protein
MIGLLLTSIGNIPFKIYGIGAVPPRVILMLNNMEFLVH